MTESMQIDGVEYPNYPTYLVCEYIRNNEGVLGDARGLDAEELDRTVFDMMPGFAAASGLAIDFCNWCIGQVDFAFVVDQINS